MAKVQINFKAEEELRDAAKIKAVKEKTTVSKALRDFLRRWIAENGDEEREG